MVRFILSDSKATLVDGIFTYSLDQRLNNASLLHLKKCSFQLTTTGTPPVAIYLRSAAVHRLSSHKHTVELKANNHQSSSDILGVLEESHTVGRYQLRGFPRPVRLKYSHLRNIDVYFSDPAGANVLAGAGGGSIFYPPPISLLEPTCRPSLIFPTKLHSPSAPRPPSPVSRRRMTLIRLSPLRTERLLGIRTTEPTEENA